MRWLLALVPCVALAQTGTIIDDDAAPPPSDTLTFTDVHSTVIDSAGSTEQRFAVMACDLNRDGYWDLGIGDHFNTNDMQLYIGDAQLTFNRRLSGGHQSDSSGIHRITSSHTCLDLNGDGFAEIYGPDADGSDAGYYLSTTTVSGALPTFATPRVKGCTGAKNRCYTADFDGDGNLERVEDAIGTGVGTATWRGRRIVDWVTGAQDYPSVTNHTTVWIPTGSTQSTAAYAIVADFDGDGWSDICYPLDNACYWNNSGTFAWTTGTGLSFEMNARNWAVGDYDRDGDLDVVSRNIDNSSSSTPTWVYVVRNNGNRTFTDVTSVAGIELGNQQGGTQTSVQGTGSYANMFSGDFDLNGCPDVLVPRERIGTDLSNRAAIWKSDCDMTFTRDGTSLDGVNLPGGTDSSKVYFKGVDFDWDGDLDVVGTSNTTQNIGIYRNTTNYSNRHSLNVRIKGPGNNKEAVGTTLYVWNAARTSRVTTHHTQEGMQGQIYPTLGLGANSSVDIDVQCPPRSGATGPRQFLDNIASNQNIVIDCSGSTVTFTTYSPGSNW